MANLLIARIDSYTKAGRYVPKGMTVSADEVDFDAKDENPAFIEAPKGVTGEAVVQISAIAPTGPNPQNPQQIANGVVQTEAGYVQDGALLIGEVTKKAEDRFVQIVDDDETQSLIADALATADEDKGKADAAAAKKASDQAKKDKAAA